MQQLFHPWAPRKPLTLSLPFGFSTDVHFVQGPVGPPGISGTPGAPVSSTKVKVGMSHCGEGRGVGGWVVDVR